MDIEPAHIDQLRLTKSGDWVEAPGRLTTDLQAIDHRLGARIAGTHTANPYLVVYYQTTPSQTDLVLTAQGTRNSFGVWEFPNQDVLERVRKIGSRDYDYAAEVEKANRTAHDNARKKFRERVGETAEQAAYAVRRDLGLKYKGRVFKP